MLVKGEDVRKALPKAIRIAPRSVLRGWIRKVGKTENKRSTGFLEAFNAIPLFADKVQICSIMPNGGFLRFLSISTA